MIDQKANGKQHCVDQQQTHISDKCRAAEQSKIQTTHPGVTKQAKPKRGIDCAESLVVVDPKPSKTAQSEMASNKIIESQPRQANYELKGASKTASSGELGNDGKINHDKEAENN